MLIPPIDLTPPTPKIDMRNNKRRIVLTHARVNFSQSQTSSRVRFHVGGVKF